MTLMEAVVALVILALVAVGCLELTQGASQLEASAMQWDAAVSQAESRMAQIVSGAPTDRLTGSGPSSGSMPLAPVRVSREPWRPGLDVVLVTVPVNGNKEFVLRRIVRAAGSPAVGGAQ